MKKTVHVVPHSHWDREWYFTTSRSKIYLMHNLQNVLDLLEKENGYDSFTLDGQASLLDDYLKWRPQDKERIVKLVKAGRLIIGPWYTQTDQLVISGESIVRNMSYGMRICKEFGDYMNVGYVPDSFGQAASMPQIYKEFGMEDTLFWRGVSDDDVEKTEYKWRGEDGSVVNVYQIPSGYYIGGAIPEEDEALGKLLEEDPFKKTWARSSTDQVYFPNGFDQAPARENLPELIERMNGLYDDQYELELSTIEKYIQSVKARAPELEEIAGELMNGKLMRIHKTIFSSRPDLKLLNTNIQNYLVNVLEPMLTISLSLGFEYPVETVREIWKLMFENAAHDSIGSCVSDNTNEDVYMRYKQARDIAMNLAELTMRKVAMRIKNPTESEITLTLFNPTATVRSEVVEAELYLPQEDFSILNADGQSVAYTILEMVDQTKYVLNQGNILDPSRKMFIPDKVYKAKVAIAASDLPSVGYTQLTVDLKGNSHAELSVRKDHLLENEFYQIKINENGSLDVLDKISGNLYAGQAILEENGDDGDSFNYSPPRKDLVIRSTEFQPIVEVAASNLISRATIAFEMAVPVTLEDRENGVKNGKLPVTLMVVLNKNSPVIDFSVRVDNRNVDSHRLCVLFDSGIASKFSVADHQFGLIQRPVVMEKEMTLWDAHTEQWNEMPIAIETCQTFVALENGERGVAVIPKGVREYEIVGEEFDTIRLTLLRTYGHMGKENLIYRPGRASGETVIETPDAQCHKIMEFPFSAYYFQGDVNEGKVANVAKDALSPVQVYQLAEFLNSRLIFTLSDVPKTLPVSYGLVETTGELTLSVVKKAEEREGIIIRLYNGNMQNELSEKLTFFRDVRCAELVDLKEETKMKLKVEDGQAVIEGVGHSKFITVYVELG